MAALSGGRRGPRLAAPGSEPRSHARAPGQAPCRLHGTRHPSIRGIRGGGFARWHGSAGSLDWRTCAGTAGALAPGRGRHEDRLLPRWSAPRGSALVGCRGRIDHSSLESGNRGGADLEPDLHPSPESYYLTFDDDQRLRWVGQSRKSVQSTEIVERTFDLEDGSVSRLSSPLLSWGVDVPSHDGTFVLGIDLVSEQPVFKNEVVRVDRETGDRRENPDSWRTYLVSRDGSLGPVDSNRGGLGRSRARRPCYRRRASCVLRSPGSDPLVAFSPDGQWIASGGEDGTVRVWPQPDLSKPRLHTLPHDELLAKLKSLTNVRIVEDPASAAGWRIDYDPFPGWAEVPEW